MTRLRLPVGQRAKELHVAVEAGIWCELEERLRASAPNEACVFALTRPSIGSLRHTTIIRELLWPIDGDVQATPQKLEISATYITRALDTAIDAGDHVGVALIHTHPTTGFGRGIGEFSARDDWYEARLFPTFTQGRPKSLCASIVLGTDPSDLDARVWWDSGSGARVQAAHVIRVVGRQVKFLEAKQSSWRDHPDPDVMDRSTRLWGAQGRRILQNLRTGVVGVGGTGSIAALALATMGVGQLQIWDKDQVKKENLHRMLGTTSKHVGMNKALAMAEVVTAVATASPFRAIPTPDWGTTALGLQHLKDCDTVMCCVDRLSARVPLNELAYAHLIPTFDVGSWIHSTQKKVDAIVTHAHTWVPGVPCAWCKQTLTSYRLMREEQGAQRGIERRVPYGLSLDDTDGTEPSVLALNMTGVSLALMEFMQVAMRISDRTPNDLKFFLPEWELDESDLATQADCQTEAGVGLGDCIPIRPRG